MTVKELIKRLQGFSGDHNVEIEVDAECGHLKCMCAIEDVQFKNYTCVLYGRTD